MNRQPMLVGVSSGDAPFVPYSGMDVAVFAPGLQVAETDGDALTLEVEIVGGRQDGD